jgi:hypothetical protein
MTRAAITAFILLFGSASVTTTTAARAESSNACKQCADQQTACRKNYPAKTCKTEFDICTNACKAK